MSTRRLSEHDLPRVLADLYQEPTPSYREDIVRQVARTRQRPAWSFMERWIPVSLVTPIRQTLAPLPWRTIGLLVALTLLIAAAVAVYLGSAPRQLPAPYGPARNGAVVLEDRGDIVALDPATGSRLHAIQGSILGTEETAPLFSRDGTRIAFLREDHELELWVANADRSDLQRRLSGPLRPLEFNAGPNPSRWMEWAPDGRSILLSTGVDGAPAITIVPTDGSGDTRTREVGWPVEGPTWRPPDGAEILLRGTPTGHGLWVLQSDGTVRSVTPAAAFDNVVGPYFGYSPDGSRIAYEWRRGSSPQLLYVVSADGGSGQPITSSESAGPSWSPDGRLVAFYDGDQMPNVVPADGSGPPIRLSSIAGGSPLLWTPDGTRVLFIPLSSSTPLLLDPAGGPPQQAPWSSANLPDWQRLAP
jgi:Tol biopolymer transport system component